MNLVTPLYHKRLLEDKFNFQSSPYVILEAIGIRPKFQDLKVPPRYLSRLKQFKDENEQAKIDNEIAQAFLYLFKAYKRGFISDPQLRPRSLMKHFIAQQSCVKNGGHILFDAVVTDNFHNRLKTYCDHLYSWYALERAMSQNFPKQFLRDFFAYQMAQSEAFFRNKYPNSFSKVFRSIAHDLFDTVLDKDRSVVYQRIKIYKEAKKKNLNQKEINKKLVKARKAIKKVRTRKSSIQFVLKKSKFGSARDTVDSEMIHHLLFGSSGSNERVVCISSDMPETIACRISIYKSIIKSRTLLSKYASMPSYSAGIFCHHDKGLDQITTIINIADIPPLFSFLDQGIDFEKHIEQLINK